MKVGVLALQGGFSLHETRLSELGHQPVRVAAPKDLAEIDALILPGGESSTLLKLTSPEFREDLIKRAGAGLPLLATCAGLILLAREVSNPPQESLKLLDVGVKRNAYGRQRESFISHDLVWTPAGKSFLQSLNENEPASLEGVFIRAPQILAIGQKTEVLIEYAPEGQIPQKVLVREGNRFGATFHPELSPGSTLIHRLFLKAARLSQ